MLQFNRDTEYIKNFIETQALIFKLCLNLLDMSLHLIVFCIKIHFLSQEINMVQHSKCLKTKEMIQGLPFF